MDRSEVIYLVKETYDQNDYGVETVTTSKRKIFASRQSATLAEWSEGGRLGLNPEYRFIVFRPEYHGEKIIEYRGAQYSVYRTYEARDDKIELYVERRQGDVKQA